MIRIETKNLDTHKCDFKRKMYFLQFFSLDESKSEIYLYRNINGFREYEITNGWGFVKISSKGMDGFLTCYSSNMWVHSHLVEDPSVWFSKKSKEIYEAENHTLLSSNFEATKFIVEFYEADDFLDFYNCFNKWTNRIMIPEKTEVTDMSRWDIVEV